MAIAVVQHNATDNSGSNQLSVSVSATGSGNLLIAFPLVVNVNVSSVSDGTNTFTQFPSARVNWTGTFAGVQTDVYYLASSTAGKTSITVTCDGSANFIEMEVWEVSGFTTVATDGKADNGTGGGTGTGTAPNVTLTGPGITTTGTTGFIVAIAGVSGGAISQNPKSGNAFTSGGDTPATDGYVSLITAAANTYTPVWLNDSATDFVCSVAAFKENTGGAATKKTSTVMTLTGIQ